VVEVHVADKRPYPGFELGNGDKFIFDLGTGSMANVMSLMIPADMLTKVFASHLHTDHVGDMAALWAGGWTGGRTGPLEVWGPSGSREDMGTAYYVDHFLKAYNWDYMTRAVKVNPIPGRHHRPRVRLQGRKPDRL
jgi:ribonuclease Z